MEEKCFFYSHEHEYPPSPDTSLPLISSHINKCNGGVESHIQHVEAFQWWVEVGWEMRWRKEVMKQFNMLKLANCRTGNGTWRISVGQNRRVSYTRRQRRVTAAGRGERKGEWIIFDTWLILIGCLNLSHFNNLNSIISL
jgi:hypothetical protein